MNQRGVSYEQYSTGMQITTISIYQIFFGGGVVLCIVKTVWTMGLFKPLSLNITKEEIIRILEGLVDLKFQEIGPNCEF